MKSINEIIKQESIFLNDWNSKEEVLRDFAGERWDWDDEKEDYFY